MSPIILIAFLFIHPPEQIEYRTLTWEDFKGIHTDSKSDATTHWIMQLNTTEDEGKYYFQVKGLFDQEGSSTRTNDLKVLLHEQLHFSICYLFSKKIKLALEKYQGCGTKRQKEAIKIFDRLSESCRIVENTYDRETNHSRCKFQQERWNKMIKSQLK